VSVNEELNFEVYVNLTNLNLNEHSELLATISERTVLRHSLVLLVIIQ
jgi:hypothetical protein